MDNHKPKKEKLPLEENLMIADEIKIIIDEDNAINDWFQYLKPYNLKVPTWLNIEWSQRDNQNLKEQILLL